MTCPHCNKDIPEGIKACFHCGKLVQEPAGFPVRQPVMNEHTWLPQITEVPAVNTINGGGRKKMTGVVTAVIAILLLGGAVGGHFLGLYTLPLLPGRAESSTETADGNESPSSTAGETKTPDSVANSSPDSTPSSSPEPAPPDPTGVWSSTYDGLSVESAFNDNSRFYMIMYDQTDMDIVYVVEGAYTINESGIKISHDFEAVLDYRRNEIHPVSDSQSMATGLDSALFNRTGDTLVMTDYGGESSTYTAAEPSGIWSFEHRARVPVVLPLEPDAGGFMRGTLTATDFRSEYLDLSFTAPTGYVMETRAELDERERRVGIPNAVAEMFVYPLNNSHGMVVMLERLENQSMTEEQFLESMTLLAIDEGYDVYEGFYIETIAGRRFVSTAIANREIGQYVSVRKIDDYMLVINLTMTLTIDVRDEAFALLDMLQPF